MAKKEKIMIVKRGSGSPNIQRKERKTEIEKKMFELQGAIGIKRKMEDVKLK